MKWYEYKHMYGVPLTPPHSKTFRNSLVVWTLVKLNKHHAYIYMHSHIIHTLKHTLILHIYIGICTPQN